jgi:hypothetical protein
VTWRGTALPLPEPDKVITAPKKVLPARENPYLCLHARNIAGCLPLPAPVRPATVTRLAPTCIDAGVAAGSSSVHPRMRGEHAAANTGPITRTGSSPHARGHSCRGLGFGNREHGGRMEGMPARCNASA